MQPGYSQFWPFAIAILAVFLIYRRLRRNFGRQPLSPVRMRVRMVLLVLVGCVLIPAALKSTEALLLDVCGVATGVALAIWGAGRTRFQFVDGQLYYYPHTYTGVVVSLLLVARLAYRMVSLYGLHQAIGGSAGGTFPPADPVVMMHSPLTVGLFGVVIGYYVCYYGTVLARAKRINPDELQTTQAPPAAAP